MKHIRCEKEISYSLQLRKEIRNLVKIFAIKQWKIRRNRRSIHSDNMHCNNSYCRYSSIPIETPLLVNSNLQLLQFFLNITYGVLVVSEHEYGIPERPRCTCCLYAGWPVMKSSFKIDNFRFWFLWKLLKMTSTRTSLNSRCTWGIWECHIHVHQRPSKPHI